ncbi:MAG: ATP-binding protein [Planctomycetes bacterium]|nr:ATP-binding protein [Planctomycetota bacterium]
MPPGCELVCCNARSSSARYARPGSCAKRGLALRIIAGDITESLSQALALRIGKKRHELWFVGNTRLTWQDGQLVVGVPNLFYHDWLQKTYGDDLASVAEEVFGQAATVRFTIDPELFKAGRRRQSDALLPLFEKGANPATPAHSILEPSAVTTSAPARADRGAQSASRARPRRFRRLEDFVVGPCNRVAHAAALDRVERPDEGPCPLVLHGPVGTGKTHLLEGIYGGLRQARPDWRLLFVSAEDFTNRFVHAMHQGKLAAFRKHFRECDALFVDDIHFLARKPATQEEFLHTFDALRAQERSVVLTCDCHPRLADCYMPELGDRLQGGALWGVSPPERQTRLLFMQLACQAPQRVALSAPVIEFLADQLRGNFRELEGALHSVYHFARVHGRPIDLASAKEALADVLRHSVRLLQLPDVEAAVCSVMGLDAKTLQARKRGWMVSHPRMLAMFLARKHTPATYAEIGQRFGGLNHSTAVAGEKKVRQWLAEDAKLNLGRPVSVRDLVEKIERELQR